MTTDPTAVELDPATMRIVAAAVRASRDSALRGAIELCEEVAKTGHSAECCVVALKELRDWMNETLPAGMGN